MSREDGKRKSQSPSISKISFVVYTHECKLLVIFITFDWEKFIYPCAHERTNETNEINNCATWDKQKAEKLPTKIHHNSLRQFLICRLFILNSAIRTSKCLKIWSKSFARRNINVHASITHFLRRQLKTLYFSFLPSGTRKTLSSHNIKSERSLLSHRARREYCFLKHDMKCNKIFTAFESEEHKCLIIKLLFCVFSLLFISAYREQ